MTTAYTVDCLNILLLHALYFIYDSVEDPSSFQNYIRMKQYVLEVLLELITPLVEKNDTVMREAFPPRDRLSITLRYLATGNSFQDLSYSARIAPNISSKLMSETLKAIIKILGDKVINCPSVSMEWQVVAEKFNYGNFLMIYAHILDGKHIHFRPSRKEGSMYRNYKDRDSIVLLGLVDAEYKFLFVNIGKNGRMRDASIFRESPLATQLYSGTLNLLISSPLPGFNINMPFVIVADDAFPLKTIIMKLYPGRTLDIEKKIFNYRLSRARRKCIWHYGKQISYSIEYYPSLCRKENKAQWYIPSELRHESPDTIKLNLDKISQQCGNCCTDTAITIRDQFCTFFNTIGAIP